MEYQCFYLNPEFNCAHDDDAEVLLETDNLAEACTFVYESFKKNGKAIAVWQPSTNSYREVYAEWLE